MTAVLLVYVTAPNKKEAERIALVLVQEKLAACVTIVPAVQSLYRWKGKVEASQELLLIIKTLRSRYRKLERRVRNLHSYEVPEIVAVPAVAGNPAYLAWVKESVR